MHTKQITHKSKSISWGPWGALGYRILTSEWRSLTEGIFTLKIVQKTAPPILYIFPASHTVLYTEKLSNIVRECGCMHSGGHTIQADTYRAIFTKLGNRCHVYVCVWPRFSCSMALSRTLNRKKNVQKSVHLFLAITLPCVAH